ncbi:hypothetical protein [Arthrobacter monumenti]
MAAAQGTLNRSTQGIDDSVGEAFEVLKASAQQLLEASVSGLTTAALNKIEEIVEKVDVDEIVDKLGDLAGGTLGDLAADKLEDLAAGGGPLMNAGFGALQAGLSGKNPVWAAFKAGWSGASTKTKAIVVLCVVLILLLAPVTLVVLLLGLLIAAIVAVIRSASR